MHTHQHGQLHTFQLALLRAQDRTALMRCQGRGRDHLGLLGLQLVIDENARRRVSGRNHTSSGLPAVASPRWGLQSIAVVPK
jgi:hypothetical protein